MVMCGIAYVWFKSRSTVYRYTPTQRNGMQDCTNAETYHSFRRVELLRDQFTIFQKRKVHLSPPLCPPVPTITAMTTESTTIPQIHEMMFLHLSLQRPVHPLASINLEPDLLTAVNERRKIDSDSVRDFLVFSFWFKIAFELLHSASEIYTLA